MTWLPPLVFLDDFPSEQEYEDELYRLFCADWIFGDPPTFRGIPIRIRNGTAIDGKDFGFWHLLTGGGNEANGPLLLERCECISWARCLIDHADTPNTRVWREGRPGRGSWLVATPDFSYVVILDERGDYLLLVTAYPEERQRRRDKRRKAYETYVREAQKLEPPSKA